MQKAPIEIEVSRLRRLTNLLHETIKSIDQLEQSRGKILSVREREELEQQILSIQRQIEIRLNNFGIFIPFVE